MFKISAIDKMKWTKKAMPAIKRVVYSEKEQDKLIKLLNDNGYPEFGEVLTDAKKYIPDAKKMFVISGRK